MPPFTYRFSVMMNETISLYSLNNFVVQSDVSKSIVTFIFPLVDKSLLGVICRPFGCVPIIRYRERRIDVENWMRISSENWMGHSVSEMCVWAFLVFFMFWYDSIFSFLIFAATPTLNWVVILLLREILSSFVFVPEHLSLKFSWYFQLSHSKLFL